MEEINFRRFGKSDIYRCAELAIDAWPIVSSLVSVDDVPNLMKAYVDINRVASTWLEVALIENKIIGFLFGKLNPDQKAVDRIISIFPSIFIILKLIIGKYGKLDRPLTFFKHLIATEQKVEHYTPQSDGQIVLFVVDSNYRGRGIGRALLNRFLQRAKYLNLKLISVYTDPLSNWNFYEKFGFVRHGAFLDDLNTYIKKNETEGFIYKFTIK